MAKLARVNLAAAPACPGCMNRLTNLPLDDLQAGDQVQCLFCSEMIRIPQPSLDRLIAQREEQRREQASGQHGFFQRIANFFRQMLSG